MHQSVVREKQVTLLDLLDRILYKGVIIYGDITLSVADVDLVYLSLKVLLTSVGKAEQMRNANSIAMNESIMANRSIQANSELGLATAAGSSLRIGNKNRG